MKYLYGDATESPLDRNYIEYLKAVLEFSVSVLTSVEAVRELNRQGKDRQKYAAKELKQLDFVAKRLANALDDCAGIETVPTTDRVLESLRNLALGEVRKAESAVRGSLEGELRKIDTSVRQHRADNLRRLEKLLLKHDLPESRQWVDVKMGDDGMYSATLRGVSTSDVSWVMQLDIPDDHLLAQPLRIDRLFPDMAIKVPEMSGWISKSVKLRTHRLGKEYVSDLAHHKGRALLRIRANIGDKDNGFDIAFNAKGLPSSIARKVKGEASEPFEPQPDDADGLRELFNRVASASSELVSRRTSLRSAKLDDKPIEEHTAPAVLVERLVAQMAPHVSEISTHSLSADELVLKRVLTDDRREEIFASKKDLREMLAPLSPDVQQIFRPLDLGIKARSKAPERPSESPAPRPSDARALRPASEAPAAMPTPAAPPVETPSPPAATPSPPAAPFFPPAVPAPTPSQPSSPMAAMPSPPLPPPRRSAPTQEGYLPDTPEVAISEAVSLGTPHPPATSSQPSFDITGPPPPSATFPRDLPSKRPDKQSRPSADATPVPEADPDEQMTRQRQVDHAMAPPPVPQFASEEMTAAIPLRHLEEQAEADRRETSEDDLPPPFPDAPGIPKPSRPPRRRKPQRPDATRNTIQGPPPAPGRGGPPRPQLDSIDTIDVDVDD